MPLTFHNLTLSFHRSSFSTFYSQFPLRNPYLSVEFRPFPRIYCARKAQRSGKLRYPSEKKKLRLQRQTKTDAPAPTRLEGVWRISRLAVSVQDDPGKDFWDVCEALLREIAKILKFPVASMLPPEAFTVVRKSFDARKIGSDGMLIKRALCGAQVDFTKLLLQKEPKFVYTVDMDVRRLLHLEPRTWDFISGLEPKIGCLEFLHPDSSSGDLMSILHNHQKINVTTTSGEVVPSNNVVGSDKFSATRKPKVVVVGSGPSGLFAALVLAEVGADVTLVERGEAVEQRGRDIGALMVRRLFHVESNFCFGEGGAGTWSDGKLVTRTGRNNSSVLTVLNTLVNFGAPRSILVDGKPHLGTDRLIPLLKNFRQYLQELGVNIRFGMRVDDLLVNGEHVAGVKISDSRGHANSSFQNLGCDAVVLAVGHSARDTYQMLISHNVNVAQKDFAVGLRIEHPQELINDIQYSGLANEVRSGRGKVPVADYQVAEYVNRTDMEPVTRSCYSFCMCPGGQVVLTSTDPSELCINGMSFSRRSSRWANAALVVTVSSKDFDALNLNGPLAGVEFQRTFERKAALMGGGNFVVPVQTVPDFLNNTLSGLLSLQAGFVRREMRTLDGCGSGNIPPYNVTSVPPSSYRLGVKAANLHDLFPLPITEALQRALSMFDEELPGFISSSALLHGVETRTSSPVQITRRSDTWESTSLKGLYPVGEGAGYAGGIVSAAVDGMLAGFAVARNLGLYDGGMDSILGKAQSVGVAKY